MVPVDVVIVGGGVQGLTLLRELTEARYSCVLVTKGGLGSGQTLHSHGLLNSGTGLLTGTLHKELHGFTIPYLRRLNVPTHGEDRSFLLAPPQLLGQLAPVWEASGYHPEPTEPSRLPRGFEAATSTSTYRVRGLNVDKRRLVEALSAGLEHLVLAGEVIEAGDEIRIGATAAGETLALRPRAVLVAAGCGSKRLLRDVLGVGEPATEKITYTKPHMICLRGPEKVLPYVGTVMSPELILVGHQVPDRRSGERLVKWYVTPAAIESVRYHDAPDDAVAEVEGRVVAAGIEALGRLFPPLARGDDRVEAYAFAGYKQDFDSQPTRRACELLDGERNVVMVLPSVLANAVPNAVDVVSFLRQRVEPADGEIRLGSSAGAAIGELTEDAPPARWTTWAEFAHKYGVHIP